MKTKWELLHYFEQHPAAAACMIHKFDTLKNQTYKDALVLFYQQWAVKLSVLNSQETA